MKSRAWALALLLLVIPTQVHAQAASLHGRLLDRASKTPVPGARLRLTNSSDTTDVHLATTRDDGTFAFQGLGLSTYHFEATRLGYARLDQVIRVGGPDLDVGSLAMSAAPLPLGGVEVEASPPPAQQNADTTEFAARAFKTHPDATAEDLVTKLPGLTVENGTVKTNGETVQQVLVDGKPFFGGDPTVALRNLPADVIDKIQVFDKLSDQAEFTGFEDGQSLKTLNLVLRPDRRNSQFGKAYGGYGDQDRFLAGGNAHLLNGTSHFSVIELSNNVNQQNFSAQDLLGVLNTQGQPGGFFGAGGNGRRGGGGGPGGRQGGGGAGFGSGAGSGGAGAGTIGPGDYLVGQQDGITTTNSIGTNYSGAWGKGLEVNQSYFFNATDDRNTQNLSRQYFAPQDSVTSYGQSSTSENRNGNHRFDSRFVWTADSSNSITDQPRLYFQNNHSSSALVGENAFAPGQPVNQAESDNAGETSGNNLSNHMVYRHRFPTRGRTISIDLGAGYTLKDGSSSLHSRAEYFQGQGSSSDTLDQRSALRTWTSTFSSRLVYTEPLGRFGLLQLAYYPGLSLSHSDNRALDLDLLTRAYTIPDSALQQLQEHHGLPEWRDRLSHGTNWPAPDGEPLLPAELAA